MRAACTLKWPTACWRHRAAAAAAPVRALAHLHDGHLNHARKGADCGVFQRADGHAAAGLKEKHSPAPRKRSLVGWQAPVIVVRPKLIKRGGVGSCCPGEERPPFCNGPMQQRGRC